VLVESPVLAAPGEHVPSLTEAGFSEVFSPSDEAAQAASDASAPAAPGGTIRAALGPDSAPSAAATVMLESSSNPVARVVEADTGVTRTVVPDAIVASETVQTPVATPTTPATPQGPALAPTVPMMPAVAMSFDDDDDETARVRRDRAPAEVA